MYTNNHNNNLNHLLITLINSYPITVHINHNLHPFTHNSFTSSIASHVQMSLPKFFIFNSTVLLSITNNLHKICTLLADHINTNYTQSHYIHLCTHSHTHTDTPICIYSYITYAPQRLMQLLNFTLKQSCYFKNS